MYKSHKLAALAVLVASSGASHACSVCIAHALGSAIHAVGSQTLPKGTTIVGVSYTSFSKSQSGEDPGIEESHHHTEVSLDVIHGLGDQWMLRASLPYVFKSLSETGESTVATKGIGDLTVGATYQIKPRPTDKVLLALTFDLKLPTGKNNLKDAVGDRLEEHSQLGTGSTDVALGVLATMEDGHKGLWFAGIRGRWNGRNGEGYRYGDALFYNLGYSRSVSEQGSVVFELNGRFAGKDRLEDGQRDENSGGHFGYASVSYRQHLGKNMGFVASYQIPVFRRLNGTQTETGLLNIGVFKKL